MDTRSHFKWNVNELLSLQREYELLEMSVQEIAAKHGRSVPAILSRLQLEGFISSWKEARGIEDFSYQDNTITYDSMAYDSMAYDSGSDTVSDIGMDLNARVLNLEDSVSDIRDMVKQMVSKFITENKSEKIAPLRKNRVTKF